MLIVRKEPIALYSIGLLTNRVVCSTRSLVGNRLNTSDPETYLYFYLIKGKPEETIENTQFGGRTPYPHRRDIPSIWQYAELHDLVLAYN